MRPTAKSLILDLLSTVGDGSMAVRALVAAGDLFGIEENAVRVALARLVAKGLVEADERASYRLGSDASSICAHVTSWRRLEQRLRTWTGDWICAATTTSAASDRTVQRHGQRALDFLGFRTIERGLSLRPNNLVGGVGGVRNQLYRLGLDPALPVFGLHALDEERAARAQELWRVDESAKQYAGMVKRLRTSLGRLRRLDAREAMVESFLLGGEAIRAIVLDPLLPEQLGPAAERKTLIELMREYDKAGRAAWAPFMRRFGAPPRRAPHDVHRSETAALAEASI